MKDLGALMKQAQAMQEKLTEAQAKLADEGWRHNKCQDTPPAAATAPPAAVNAEAVQNRAASNLG